MVPQNDSEFNVIIKDTTTLLNKIDSLSLVGAFSFAKDRIPVYVKTLYDGYEGFINQLVSGSFDKLIDRQVEFLHLPISESCEMFENPLLLLCDSTEPDKECIKKMTERKRTGYSTYPLILFPDTFFELTTGERLSYVDICDSVETYTEQPVLPLKYADFSDTSSYLKDYLQCINYGMRLDMALSCIDEASDYIAEKYFANEEEKDGFIGLAELAQKRAAIKRFNELEEVRRQAENLIRRWNGAKSRFREIYDKRIHAFVFRNENSNASPVAVRLDLKYNTMAGDIERLAEMARNTEYIDRVCMKKTYDLANRTTELLNSNTTKLAFIGTFSSGKTTLINSLLAMKHALPTSARHNTAILTQIDSSNEPYDYYEIDYSDKIEWQLASPAVFDCTDFVNNFGCKAKVMSIKKENNEYIVWLRAMEAPHLEWRKRVPGARELCVSKNDIVDSGASLTRVQKDRNTWHLCSYNELMYIEELLKNGEATNASISGISNNTDKKNMLNAIKALKSLSGGVDNPKVEKLIRAEELATKLGVDSNRLETLTFICKLKKLKNNSVRLDSDAAWIKLCGNPDDKKTIPFTEQPDCYMSAKKLNLFFRNDFLKYSTLIDTPGLGSTTDKHDNITERYIRDEANHLIVMVAINAHTDDMKFNDLISRIAELYDRYNKNKNPDNVRFMLNCFSDAIPIAECARCAEKTSAAIVARGFKKENIFACNLRKAISAGITNEKIAGCRTYDEFKTVCLEQVLVEGCKQRYLEIQLGWEKFFKEGKGEILREKQKKIQELDGESNAINKKKRDLTIASAIKIPDLKKIKESIRKDFSEIYESYYGAFVGTRKGFFTHHRLEAIHEVHSAYFGKVGAMFDKWKKDEDDICRGIQTCALEMECYAGRDDIRSEFPSETDRNLIVITYQGILSLMIEADSETCWYNKSKKTDYYMRRLARMLKEDCDKSLSNIEAYFEKYLNKLQNYKKYIVDKLSEEIESFGNSDKLKANIEILDNAERELEALEREFKKINFDIEEKYNEKI